MVIGIDVAKDTIVLASEPAGVRGTFATDVPGLGALVAQCQAQPVALVVLKATGRLAKTDAIDATVLALFGARVQPAVGHLADGGPGDATAAAIAVGGWQCRAVIPSRARDLAGTG